MEQWHKERNEQRKRWSEEQEEIRKEREEERKLRQQKRDHAIAAKATYLYQDEKTNLQLQQEARDTLNNKDDILAFQIMQIQKTKDVLKEWDQQHGKPMNSEQLAEASDNALMTRNFEKLDRDWDNWGKRRTLIRKHEQETLDKCVKSDNTKEKCLCALQGNPKTGWLIKFCTR